MIAHIKGMGSPAAIICGALLTSGPLCAQQLPSSITDTFAASNGVLSPSNTTIGLPLSATWSVTTRGVGTNVIQLSGFSSDPGQGFLNSITCSGAISGGTQTVTLQETDPTQIYVVNGTTLNSNIAPTYSYSGTTGTWSWPDTHTLGTAGQVNCSITYGGTSGIILPKYKVVGLTYAPPGSKSVATYTNGFMSGNSTSNASSFVNTLTVTSKLNSGVDLFGFVSGTVTNTASASWTQEQDNNSSLNLQQQYTDGLQVPGPPLVAGIDQGVDHDYDTVYIWINPADSLMFSGPAVVASGEYYDDRDGNTPETCGGQTYAGITGLDVVTLTIGQLRGTQPISDPCLQVRLSRPWDTALGGLDATDFAAIAAADPFYTNPSFDPNHDTSNRYEIPKGDSSFPFIPGSATHTFSSMYTSTSTQGQSAKSTYTVSFTVAGQASGSFVAHVADNFSVSNKVTYTNQSSSTVSNSTNQSMSYSVVPPAVGTYTGATQVQVWKDNIYGTFMFFPMN